MGQVHTSKRGTVTGGARARAAGQWCLEAVLTEGCPWIRLRQPSVHLAVRTSCIFVIEFENSLDFKIGIWQARFNNNNNN